jgi:hypothetical protein
MTEKAGPCAQRATKTLLWAVLTFALVLPDPAAAAQIFGTIRSNTPKDDRPPFKVEITCAGKLYADQTDGYGSYRVYVPDRGKCSLRVTAPRRSEQFDVYSYEDPVRYDFVLVAEAGRLLLQRR